MRGDVESDENVLLLRRVHVVYELLIESEQTETAKRVHDFHARYCPVARSLAGAIECTTELHVTTRRSD